MTLADEFIEAGNRAWPREDICARFRFMSGKIRAAQRFVVEQETAFAINALLESRPSSLFSALRFARLPYPLCWFDLPMPTHASPLNAETAKIERVGALVEQISPTCLCMSTAWKFERQAYFNMIRDVTGDAPVRIKDVPRLGMSALQAAMELSPLYEKPVLGGDWFDLPIDSKSSTNKFVHSDPREEEAARKIEQRIAFRMHKENFGDQVVIQAQMSGRTGVSLIRDVADEIGKIIATLILINSRNCVDILPMVPDSKLNKARIKRGSSELVSFSTVRIKLNQAAQRAVGGGVVDRQQMRQHLVRGHFKVRKTGVFWWHHFIRGDEAQGKVERHGYSIAA